MTPVRLQALKPNGKPHQSWTSNLVAQSDDWILTQTPYATSVRHHTKGLDYAMQHSNFGIFNTKEYYNLFIDLTKDGAFKMLYINVATPAIIKDNVVTWTDLELDVVRMPGEPAKLVDEDEFQEAKASGLLSPDLADKAETVAKDLMKVVDRGSFPFLAMNYEAVAKVVATQFSIEASNLQPVSRAV